MCTGARVSPPTRRTAGAACVGWSAGWSAGWGLAILLAVGLAVCGSGLAAQPRFDGAELAAWLQQCPQLGDCAEATEREALRDPRWSGERTGLQLVLGPAPAPHRFEDRDGLRHRLLGELGQTGLALVVAQEGAVHRFWLVDLASPRAWSLPSLPWPSPDGRLLALPSGPDASEASEGGVSLWLRVGTRWTRPFVFEAPGLQLEGRGWRADGAAFRLQWSRAGTPKRCTGALQLRDGPYGWELVPPPPAHCP